MATPTQRRTLSSKKRRASHFALKKQTIVKDKAGALHLPHRAAPGATEYNGHPIHVKGRARMLEKLAGKKTEDTGSGPSSTRRDKPGMTEEKEEAPAKQ